MTDAAAPKSESGAPSASGADEDKASTKPAEDTPAPADKGKAKEEAKETPAPPAEAPVEIIDVDEIEVKPAPPAARGQPPQSHQPPPPQMIPFGLRAFNIDVSFEASKLPLDVAIFNSARAAGGDEKIRKYLQAVLVVGGTALVPGMAHALESRYVAVVEIVLYILGRLTRPPS